LIDNIFIDNIRYYTIKPCINGLSDHDAQLITLKNFPLPISNTELADIRNINTNTIAEFQLQLSGEQWDNIFGNNNVNDTFNDFLNTYLRCFHFSFIKKEITSTNTPNQWITKGIKISCQKKKGLFLLCKHSNDLNFKVYYKRYCAVVSKVILTAKNCIIICILNSRNKMKSTWEIINQERGEARNGIDIQLLIIDNNEIINQKQIANIFNNYFLTIADRITSDNNNHRNTNMTHPINYLANSFRKPFANVQLAIHLYL
jgi:hypothetical protein